MYQNNNNEDRQGSDIHCYRPQSTGGTADQGFTQPPLLSSSPVTGALFSSPMGNDYNSDSMINNTYNEPPRYSQLSLNRGAQWAADTVRYIYSYLTSATSVPQSIAPRNSVGDGPGSQRNSVVIQLPSPPPIQSIDNSTTSQSYIAMAQGLEQTMVYQDPHQHNTYHIPLGRGVQTLEIAVYENNRDQLYRAYTARVLTAPTIEPTHNTISTRVTQYYQPDQQQSSSDDTLVSTPAPIPTGGTGRPVDYEGCFSISEILGESSCKRVPASANPSDHSIIGRFAREASRRSVPSLIQNEDKSRKWSRILRIINLLRALLLSAYGIYNILSTWNLPIYHALGARPYFVGTIIFLAVDTALAFVQAFPRTFWCCWDVDKMMQTRSFSIWSLVADHQLMIDLFPILANLILRIYGFRLDQITVDYTTSDTSTLLYSLGISASQATINTGTLGIYAFSLLLTITIHSFRISRLLIIQRAAYILTIIVWIKVLFLCFDLLANGFLLYEVIYIQGDSFFELTTYAALVLSVFAVSPLVTTSTNVLLNIALHYKYLRMQLCSLKLPTGEKGCKVPRHRVFHASARKTFNPLLMATAGKYAFYSTCALIIVASHLFELTYEDFANQLPTIFSGNGVRSTWTSWLTNNDDRRQTFRWIIMLNIIFNYAIGAAFGCFYWAAEAIRGIASSWSMRYSTGR